MVLVLENALVRTGLFTLDRDYPAIVLNEAARILSERVSGRTVAEIRAGVLASVEVAASDAGRCASDLASRGQELFADVETGELQLEGVTNILNEPEFSEPGPLKSLIRFLESPGAIRDTLHRLNLESGGGLRVWIGAEIPVGGFTPFSLLSSSFDLGGREGILAVLGPRRMPYQRAVSGIQMLRNTLRSLS
jgi:heat-inducible transcriptional repressor